MQLCSRPTIEAGSAPEAPPVEPGELAAELFDAEEQLEVQSAAFASGKPRHPYIEQHHRRLIGLEKLERLKSRVRHLRSAPMNSSSIAGLSAASPLSSTTRTHVRGRAARSSVPGAVSHLAMTLTAV